MLSAQIALQNAALAPQEHLLPVRVVRPLFSWKDQPVGLRAPPGSTKTLLSLQTQSAPCATRIVQNALETLQVSAPPATTDSISMERIAAAHARKESGRIQ